MISLTLWFLWFSWQRGVRNKDCAGRNFNVYGWKRRKNKSKNYSFPVFAPTQMLKAPLWTLLLTCVLTNSTILQLLALAGKGGVWYTDYDSFRLSFREVEFNEDDMTLWFSFQVFFLETENDCFRYLPTLIWMNEGWSLTSFHNKGGRIRPVIFQDWFILEKRCTSFKEYLERMVRFSNLLIARLSLIITPLGSPILES